MINVFFGTENPFGDIIGDCIKDCIVNIQGGKSPNLYDQMREIASSAFGYKKIYSAATTNGFVHSIINDYDKNNVIDIRPNIDNNNRLTIKILDSTNNFSTIALYDSCNEIEHYFEDPIYLTIGESQSTSIIDSKGQIFIPLFSNDGKTEIKLLAITKPDYIINSDQIIET